MPAALRYKNKTYDVTADFALVREIERELGNIVALERRFAGLEWQVCDLVTLTQMMLQSVGETVDYVTLGNAILKGGLQRYLAASQDFLQLVISGHDA